MKIDGTKPDGYFNGIPVYIKTSRGNGKSKTQFKIYSELLKARRDICLGSCRDA